MRNLPPKIFHRFFRWYCHPRLLDHIEGDLIEEYNERLKITGKRKADSKFILDVLLLFRPGIIRPMKPNTNQSAFSMYTSYFRIGWRNLINDKGYSVINVGGLAIGMTVAIFIGLWVHDELSANKENPYYDHIVQVAQHQSLNDRIETYAALPLPLAEELRNSHGSDLELVAATIIYEQMIGTDKNVIKATGSFAESQLPEILSLTMVHGVRNSITDQKSVLISESLATSIFGNDDPINKELKINNAYTQRVTGVYKDIARTSRFKNVKFVAPVSLLVGSGASNQNWASSSFSIFARMNPASNRDEVSSKITNILSEKSGDPVKPSLFLYPMSKWHLYEFRNGVMVGARLQFVWLFGLVGGFVLILACINFMNLFTARSQKRAKEIGVRKTMGSYRLQLIQQFFSESFITVVLSFIVSIIFVIALLPQFISLSGKEIDLPFANYEFWAIAIVFIFITGLLAGGYPALHLSAFNVVKALKGGLSSGKSMASLRRTLVFVQFTVSIALIIGTIVVFQQIQFAKDRPVGYNRSGLMMLPYDTPEIINNYKAFRNELLNSSSVENISISSGRTTDISSSANNLSWEGKDPDVQAVFGTILIDPFYDDVVNWKVISGRNFSEEFVTDTSAFIFNEAAIRQMGLKNPVGKIVKWHGRDWPIIGVVKDMVMESPFEPAVPTVFLMDPKERLFTTINIRLKSDQSISASLSAVEAVFKKYNPSVPFDFSFADSEYETKFASEERIGKLASTFALLAILISLMGIFGLASFVAEQRSKEIGIRKVVGASVVSICKLLSRDFVLLALISSAVAAPFTFYFLSQWLESYHYHVTISWTVFVITTAGILLLTLTTVGFHAIKAALQNPVKSLRSE
jgi:putative ABC transport system permease protein